MFDTLLNDLHNLVFINEASLQALNSIIQDILTMLNNAQNADPTSDDKAHFIKAFNEILAYDEPEAAAGNLFRSKRAKSILYMKAMEPFIQQGFLLL